MGTDYAEERCSWIPRGTQETLSVLLWASYIFFNLNNADLKTNTTAFFELLWITRVLHDDLLVDLPKLLFSVVDNYNWLVNGSAQNLIDSFMKEEHSFDQYTEVNLTSQHSFNYSMIMWNVVLCFWLCWCTPPPSKWRFSVLCPKRSPASPQWLILTWSSWAVRNSNKGWQRKHRFLLRSLWHDSSVHIVNNAFSKTT